MDRRGLYDDRAYWKQALALKNAGMDVFYLVIDYESSVESHEGTTPEGIHYQIFAAKKYIPNILLNYALKKFTPISTELDEMLNAVIKIKPELIQIVDLRILRILDALKRLEFQPKIIYDIREPREQNLLDLRMKSWRIPFELKKRYARYIQNWEYRQASKCDFILGVDDGIGAKIQLNLPDKPYLSLYNFTNLATERAHIPLQNRKYDAAYVGALSELRGAKTMLHALKIVVATKPDFKLLFLGKAYPKSLGDNILDFVEKNGLEKNLDWIQGVDFQEVSGFYNQVKIGLNPLHHISAHEEIMQIKLFEYMNYGIPLITSNFGKMCEIVVESKTGICIAPNRPEILAASLLHLLSNEDEMKEYSLNGIAAVDKKYNWSIMEKAYLEIIKSLI
ncbi:MAG: glycosyltransferase [Flavobacteriaceae bacterium]|nr:glycosyltransferase [Flavobacteriaceae bacterium]